MQIPKTRSGPSENPTKASPVMFKSRRLAKGVGSETNDASANPHKVPSEKSPRIESRPAAKTMETEKKRSSRVTELEYQIPQLQEELKRAREQLNLTESWKRRAQQEADDAKQQLLLMSMKLQDSKTQLAEISAAEETRIQELRKISQERDRAWQTELEALQNQHSADSAALASAMADLRRLKLQLEIVLRSEAALANKSETDLLELQSLKNDLAEAEFAIDNLKLQLSSNVKAEREAKSMLNETRKQLEIAQNTIESLLTDGSKLMESFSIVATELKESRSRVKSLEETVGSLQEQHYTANIQALLDLSNRKRFCLGSPDNEVEQWIEESWILHHQEKIESIVNIQCADETMARMITEFDLRELELKQRLNDTKSEVTALKANLFDRETELRRASDMNRNLLKETMKRREDDRIQTELLDRETAVERLCEENKQLKSELRKKEAEMEVATTNKESAAKSEEEMKAVRAEKSEIEVELRKLKVQAEQWKKAAETAIGMLTDSECKPPAEKLMSLPFAEVLEDEYSSIRKKKSFVFRRIRGMWNKEQK